MHGRSAEALEAVLAKTDAVLDGGADAGRLGGDLFAIVRTLDGEHLLRRVISDATVQEDAKSALFASVFEGKVSKAALEVGDEAVRERWSRSVDLVDALEEASVAAQVARAAAEGALDQLEDDLFRFGRILHGEPQLRDTLADPASPQEGKEALLKDLLGDKVSAATLALLGQAVAGRARTVAAALDHYQELAAARRSKLVATAWVAAPLDDDHKERLARALSAQYDRDVHLNVIVDPSVLGGVRVAVGDEVIDSTVETRLKQLQRQMSH